MVEPDDITQELRQAESASGYWSPGARLVARSTTTPLVRRSTSRSSGLLIAAAILLLAVLIAVGLWLAASWARADEEPSTGGTASPIQSIQTFEHRGWHGAHA